ncbi:hypothetical protein Cantr_03495 [Candida viswanathii]|uniref:Nucleolar protein 19 n=1 Tax=Candida viswanathii TaxID=5486 RepID=A0A367YPW0_9ASCO|nr:hypothetical protein Cantr_03495 [Candida viswanathii]
MRQEKRRDGHAIPVMSRRQEIKRKEELQARFQLAISNNNQKALNWLKPLKGEDLTTTKDDEDSFLNLQIIPQGSSLDSKQSEGGQKIGDFLASKDISKSKQLQQQQSTMTRKQTNSKPMLALMNKMRDTSRKNVSRNYRDSQNNPSLHKAQRGDKPVTGNNSKHKSETHNQESDDDDEEEEDDSRDIRSRTAKKGSTLLLEQKLNKGGAGGGGVGKKKGKRPF